MATGSLPEGRVRIPIRVDRFVATVDAPESIAAIVRSLLADQVRSDSKQVGALVEIGAGDRIRVDGRLWDPDDGQSLSDQLIYVLMQASLDADADRLHLHAGLVAHEGRGLLIGGVSGSGKSTLVAQLVRAGFDYCTDERVSLARDGSLSALEKPISVVSGSFGVLADQDPTRTGAGAATPRIWHVPASSVRAHSQLHAAPPLAAIALVEYRRGTSFESVPMHPATVARVLLSDCVDVDRFGADGPMTVAAMCASVPCMSMIHDGGEEVPAAVRETLAGMHQHTPLDVIPVDGGSRRAPGNPVSLGLGSRVGRASGIRGAVISDRAVVRTASGDVVELDETLTAWLLLMDGESMLGEIVRDVALEVGMDEADLAPNAVEIVNHLAAMAVVA